MSDMLTALITLASIVLAIIGAVGWELWVYRKIKALAILCSCAFIVDAITSVIIAISLGDFVSGGVALMSGVLISFLGGAVLSYVFGSL